MNKNSVKLLKSFRNFVYTDLDSLDPYEIARLLINLSLIKEYGFSDLEINKKSMISLIHDAVERLDLKSNETLKREQADFSDRFHDVLKNISKEPQTESLINPFQLHISISAAVDEGSIRVKLQHPPNALAEDGRLFLVFLRTINGLETKYFRKCPECEQWFFHFSKRAKMYCNNKCAARKGNRERRAKKKEVDPVAYKKELAENAQRARDSYVRKVKDELGDSVVPDRRPRKNQTE